jgi:3-dehydroquinate dehydratase/shikimate dehydrogenase
MTQQDPDVVKLAVTAQTPADNLRILELLRDAPVPTVAHCMGDIGFPSRLLALRHNVPFIYAAFNRERGVAPGLPAFEDLLSVYDVGRIDGQTRVFGVVGDPVGHSLGPVLHNALFRKLGINALYLPFRVPRGGLPAFLSAFAAVPVDGYSVTIPHKEAAAKAASECEAAVAVSGAANTLVRQNDRFVGHNTDYQAVLECLAAALPGEDGLRGKRALLLGAGGVARAVAHALRSCGAHVTIAGRTHERATELAAQVDGKAVEWTARHGVDCDLAVNGTPVGMHPNVDESPLHHSFLRPELAVFETVYTPETTLLVKEARARGCTVVTGTELFVRQAALQFRLFTGREAPLDLVRSVLKRALSPVTLGEEEG